MRSIPGWVIGAAGVGVVAGAFFLGGRLAASDVTSATTMVADAAPGMQFECEPGQRAVLRQSDAVRAGGLSVVSMACVGEPAALGGRMQTASLVGAPAMLPAMVPAAQPAVRQATRPAAKTRSTEKSVAIIAGSTAAGAVVGGVAKGKKGAVVGGIVGGAAATIWDQVTRKRAKERR